MTEGAQPQKWIDHIKREIGPINENSTLVFSHIEDSTAIMEVCKEMYINHTAQWGSDLNNRPFYAVTFTAEDDFTYVLRTVKEFKCKNVSII